MAVNLIDRGEHLTNEGLRKLVSIRSSMNKGLTETLKESFPGLTPVDRPSVEVPEIIDPDWIAGFTDGEGCFYIKIVKSKTHQIEYQITMTYILTQDSRDLELMKKLAITLSCGVVYQHSGSSVIRLTVTKSKDLFGKIIPLLKTHELQGIKKLDFEDFCKVAEIVKVKRHLTKEGLEEIFQIQAGMNKGRK